MTRNVTAHLAQTRQMRDGWLDILDQPSRDLGQACVLLSKYAAEAALSPTLSGQLYASKSGWLLLSVPNALVRGAFDALDEPGIELPLSEDGKLNAHVSVMRKEEVDQVGGIDKITERGKRYSYNLGPMKSVTPMGWDGISKVWFLSVTSPELAQFRKTYGLPPLPVRGDTELPFHLTVARRAINVLGKNPTSKATP